MKLPRQKKTSGNPSLQKCSKNFNSFTILLMEEILHQFAGSLSHYLQGFLHPGWCRISSIWHIVGLEEACSATQLHWVQQSWRSDKRPRDTVAPLIVRWLHLHVIKRFDQILQCILVVEGIESKTIHQSISSQFLGLFHLPGTSKSLVKLGEKSVMLSLGEAPRRTVPRAAASSPAVGDVEIQLLPANYIWVQHLWLNKSAVDFIPKKTSLQLMVIFSWGNRPRGGAKKRHGNYGTWDAKRAPGDGISVPFCVDETAPVFLGFRNVISLNR